MPITPEQARALTIADLTHLKAIEEEFDKDTERESKNGRVTIVVTIAARRISDKLSRELVRRYKAAGWTATYRRVSDQRDGDFYEFTFAG
jgi:hypothetical protein